ncbi:MAG: hypothetical protein K2Z76_15160 [Mycobacterium gordonae]|nr:hypothetical protein [Mycobacterium gordonae]
MCPQLYLCLVNHGPMRCKDYRYLRNRLTAHTPEERLDFLMKIIVLTQHHPLRVFDIARTALNKMTAEAHHFRNFELVRHLTAIGVIRPISTLTGRPMRAEHLMHRPVGLRRRIFGYPAVLAPLLAKRGYLRFRIRRPHQRPEQQRHKRALRRRMITSHMGNRRNTRMRQRVRRRLEMNLQQLLYLPVIPLRPPVRDLNTRHCCHISIHLGRPHASTNANIASLRTSVSRFTSLVDEFPIAAVV